MYKSCNIIQHGLCFYDNMLVSCCFSPVDQIDGQKPPILYKNYKGQILTKEDLFERIHKYTEVFKNGGCPDECRNCYHIKEQNWDESEYIDYITITHFSNCNADCIYCSNNNERFERTNNTYKIMPVLNSLKEQGLIKKGCEFHIGGGEFTIYKECDEILKTFAVNNFARVFIPTNAIRYNENLFRAMNEANTYIIVSLDCGSRNMYKKLKRVDAFDKVIENLTKYAATPKSKNVIRLKYIIVPTFNDNIREFKKFLGIAKNLGVKNIIIDIDGRYSRITNFKIDDYYINLAKKMNDIAIKHNFITEFYSFFFQNINEKEIKNISLIEGIIKRFKFKYLQKEFKNLYQNRKYTDV